jgi:hypothetical protein
VFNDGQTLEAWQERHERERAKGYNGNGGGTPLAMQVQMLPTPTASDWKGPNRSESGTASSRGMATVAETLLPTPTASDRFGAGNHGEGGADLRTTVDTLFPTPRATDGTNGGPNQRGTSGDLMLPSAVQLLPTPDASMGNGGRQRSPEALASGDHQANLNDLPRLLPTPTAMDSRASGGSTPTAVTLTDAVVRTSLGARTNPRFADGELF